MDGSVIQHKELAASGRWGEMPFAQQMANIGSEVFRAAKWKDAGKTDRALRASDRALELLDLTVSSRQQKALEIRELLRLRELLCDYFYGENLYAQSSSALNHYFEPFSMKAAEQRRLSATGELG